jgi:hypothetical protein
VVQRAARGNLLCDAAMAVSVLHLCCPLSVDYVARFTGA